MFLKVIIHRTHSRRQTLQPIWHLLGVGPEARKLLRSSNILDSEGLEDQVLDPNDSNPQTDHLGIEPSDSGGLPLCDNDDESGMEDIEENLYDVAQPIDDRARLLHATLDLFARHVLFRLLLDLCSPNAYDHSRRNKRYRRYDRSQLVRRLQSERNWEVQFNSLTWAFLLFRHKSGDYLPSPLDPPNVPIPQTAMNPNAAPNDFELRTLSLFRELGLSSSPHLTHFSPCQ